MGANESVPLLYTWSGGLPIRFSPRLLPWLAILGLCLLRPNRRLQAWLVWLPVAVVAGLGFGIARWIDPNNEGGRFLAEYLPTALALGWAAALLLGPSLSPQSHRGPFTYLLLTLGIFSLFSLAAGHDWSTETFMQFFVAVALEFIVFAVAAALSLAGRSISRRFTAPRLIGWFALWSLVIWLALGIPLVTLTLLSGGEAMAGVAGVVGCCWCISFVVSSLFLLLAVVPCHRQRLQALLQPPRPAPAPATVLEPTNIRF